MLLKSRAKTAISAGVSIVAAIVILVAVGNYNQDVKEGPTFRESSNSPADSQTAQTQKRRNGIRTPICRTKNSTKHV